MSEQPVGDLLSLDKGSGARFNQGKPALDLIPLNILAEFHAQNFKDVETITNQTLADMLVQLGDFQIRTSGAGALWAIIAMAGDKWDDCARVFDFGRKKYAAWNWSKGMPWSVPIGCIARHIRAMLRGEYIDPESNLPHIGHVFCNLVMLLVYIETFPEGDDRPPAEHFEGYTTPNGFRTTQTANL